VDQKVIAGRYEVIRPIGSGGMGTVWLCRDTVLGREVAVKQIGALPGEPAAAARAMREARIAASLNHPNAVGVFDVVDQDAAHWLVMEYVDGESLAEQIRDHGALPPTKVAAIGAAVADALARAHDRGIVHRDIKPGNILMDRGGKPKISDFGIARAQADDQLTQTGYMTGTPGYLSPELARGGNPTAASDVWALGATLYYAVEGHPPYEAQANPLAILQQIAHGEAEPMEKAGPLAGAISAMMDPDPARRWDMATAADRLRAISAGDTTLALAPGAIPGAAAPTEVIGAPVEATQRVAPPVPLADDGYAGGPGYVDDEDEDRRGGGRGWLWALIALLLLGIVALLAYQLTDGFGSNKPQPSGTQTVTATNTKTVTPSTTSSTTPSSTTSSSSTTSQTPSSTTSSTTTTTQPTADPQAIQDFLRGYYANVTKKGERDSTWAMLTPAMQQQSGGRDAYESFWENYKSVEVGEMQVNGDQVIAQLTFVPKDKGGDGGREVKQFTVQRSGDKYLIAAERTIG